MTKLDSSSRNSSELSHTRFNQSPVKMKNHSLLLLAAAFGLTAVPVSAAVTTVNDSQSAETAYTVTSGDLLESATVAAQSGWTTNNGSDYNELTDGAYGSIYVSGPIEIDGAWDNPAGTATITYDLDLSGAGGGYDITSIVSYAGWSSASLGQQVITVEYSTVGSAGWTSLGTGTNQPAPASVSTRVTFEDDTNPGVDVIASGVDAIRFTSGDWTVFREFDAIGTATIPEPSVAALLGLGGLALLRRRRD